MTTTDSKQRATHGTKATLWPALGAALLAALARLGVVAAAATLLFVLLLNEVAAALVYVLAAALALFFAGCPPA